MKNICLFLIIIAIVFTGFNTLAYERDEKRALESIQVLLLKGDYGRAADECDDFLREYRGSKYRSKAKHYKDIALKKTSKDRETPETRVQKPEKETYYIVQIGAFDSYKNATKLKRELKRKKFDSVIIKVRRGSKIFYRVRAGKFQYLTNARKLAKDLKRKGYASEIINEEG